MGIPVDQFMQVSCRFQLTSETEYSESIHGNQERVRLCTSAKLDNESTLIIMVCSNELSNNHIIAYYIEKTKQIPTKDLSGPAKWNSSPACRDRAVIDYKPETSDRQNNSQHQSTKRRTSRVLVKQIYYHNYNEDIVAISLSEFCTKLALVNASSTIYILPIKNILLNLDSKISLNLTQSKATHFYDAEIIESCQLENPTRVAFCEDPQYGKPLLLVSAQSGDLRLISIDEKKLFNQKYLKDRLPSLKVFQNKSKHNWPTYNLEPDESIKEAVMTERFFAIATSHDRCLINSRNCFNLKNSSQCKLLDLDPLLKEIRFTNDEKILTLIKSPVSNDADGIIDSFLLVTTRSIYSIEARQSCRDMFINLIDSHLGLRRQSEIGFHLSRQFSESWQSSRSSWSSKFSQSSRTSHMSQASLANCDQHQSDNFLTNRGELYERICYDSRAFSTLFKLDLSSLYEAYGDKLLIRRQFQLADRFFKMANFDHCRIIGKYIRLSAYKDMISYITNVLTDENEILDEKERIDLSKAAFECLLAKTLVERSKVAIYHNKLERIGLDRLVASMNKQEKVETDDQSNHLSQEAYQICEHTPKGDKAKLSSATIVGTDESIAKDEIDNANGSDDPDDEGTLLANLNHFSQLSLAGSGGKTTKYRRLECEKSLINFFNNLLPQSLYSYALTRLVDFGLIDLADSLARSDVRINSLIRILLHAKDENRRIFRDNQLSKLVSTLSEHQFDDLVRLDSSKYLEFITTPEVTRALAKDTSLTTEYLGPHQKNHFRKYSVAALRQLEAFKDLVLSQKKSETSNDNQRNLFNKQQKHSIENIFTEFLSACLYESTGDSCRLWSNYINFYLNHVGSKNELQSDILHLIEQNSTDCRLAITLFKAIEEDENESKKGIKKSSQNLSQLFDNVFLVTLLERTLLLVPQSADLDALSDCLGVDGFMGQVPLPVENLWREILESIKTAAG